MKRWIVFLLCATGATWMLLMAIIRGTEEKWDRMTLNIIFCLYFTFRAVAGVPREIIDETKNNHPDSVDDARRMWGHVVPESGEDRRESS